MKKVFLFSSLFILLLLSDYSQAEEIMVNGQASAWVVFNGGRQLGMRYIPDMRVSHPLAEGKDIDGEISLNLFTWAPFNSMEDFGDNADLKLYRLWVRYATSQLEMRLGLQKIN